jgi:hypothetical protein
MNPQQRALVAQELQAVPRGGLDQNIYRMGYEQARLNGLGSRAQIAATPWAAYQLALRTVRKHYPNFQPRLLS